MQLSSSGTEQCSSSFSSRPRTAHCMQEPSTSHFHRPSTTFPAPAQGTSTSNEHTQASIGCSSLRGFWMRMDIKALLFKASALPCICSNLSRTSQRSDTAMQLWADVGTAKHSLCHRTQEFTLRLWGSLKYLLCSSTKHQNWECSKRWQHSAPAPIFKCKHRVRKQVLAGAVSMASFPSLIPSDLLSSGTTSC